MFIIELGIWRFRSMCQFHTGLYIRVLHCIFLYLLVSHGIALYSTIFHGITTPAAMQQSFANDDCCSAVCLRHRSARQRMPCHLPCVLREILFVQFILYQPNCIVLYCIIWYDMLLHDIAALQRIILLCIVLHGIVWYMFGQFGSTLQDTCILHCIF